MRSVSLAHSGPQLQATQQPCKTPPLHFIEPCNNDVSQKLSRTASWLWQVLLAVAGQGVSSQEVAISAVLLMLASIARGCPLQVPPPPPPRAALFSYALSHSA